VLETEGAMVAECFFKNGYGNIDSEISDSLIHINPPVTNGKIDYASPKQIHTFASDYVVREISDRYLKLAEVIDWFNAGLEVTKKQFGATSDLFEKIFLWLKPLSRQTIQIKQLLSPTTSTQPVNVFYYLSFVVPDMKILPYDWKLSQRLEQSVLYQPSIANLESGNAFCVLPSDRNNDKTLIVFQVTVADTHPVKANGLKKYINNHNNNINVKQ
jgi:hypothetical protein